MAGLAAMSALTPVPAARRAINLAWATIVITLVEGAISTTYGIHGESLSLFGFGADSLIELASALLVWWRIRALGSGGPGSQGRERIAGFIISGLLVLLAIGVSAGSIWRFIHHVQPATTIPAAIIAATSMLLMVWLWRAKSAVAHELNSQALHQDAICALGCVNATTSWTVSAPALPPNFDRHVQQFAQPWLVAQGSQRWVRTTALPVPTEPLVAALDWSQKGRLPACWPCQLRAWHVAFAVPSQLHPDRGQFHRRCAARQCPG